MSIRERREKVDFNQRKERLMENCFNCYAENGFYATGISALADACGIAKSTFYDYFDNLDDLIIQSTAFNMTKVQNDFAIKAPRTIEGLHKCIDEIPYWTAEKHGQKYRLMYQIYTHPKYCEAGQKFFASVNKRFSEYARTLEETIGVPADILIPLIYTLIRASVHYALFGDEPYLQSQLKIIKMSFKAFIDVK